MKHFKNARGSFNYSIKKSNRKTVSIIVEADSSVRVLAPNKMNQTAIEALLDKKTEWITTHLEKMANRKVDPLAFETGNHMLYLGDSLVLKVNPVKGKREERIIASGGVITAFTSNAAPEYVKNGLINWFRLRSEEILNERVAFYAQKMGKIPNRVVVKTQTKRWGSCSSKRDIFLNWRLVFAPIEVIDYVIIHELSHLVYMNHSSNFWHLVETYDSKYKTHRSWLKENGQQLFQM